jgi:phosphoglucomutase
VDKPNPEYKETFRLGIEQADREGITCVVATDPDADRMGVALKGRNGRWTILNGNTLSVILAEHRIRTLKKSLRIPLCKPWNAVLIKSFVTTPMLDAIAKKYSLKLVNTPTGFKWIGAKLADYESQMVENLYRADGTFVHYDKSTARRRQILHLRHGCLFVFGCEESQGFLANDVVRDKDANAAVLLLCEWMAYLKHKGLSPERYLDRLYVEYGYFGEETFGIQYEGAIGSQKIENILESYRRNTPASIGGIAVTAFTDFGRDIVCDDDNKRIAPHDMYRVQLEDESSFMIRGSGTEPKLKIYLFAHRSVPSQKALHSVKREVCGHLASLGEHVRADVESRCRDVVT